MKQHEGFIKNNNKNLVCFLKKSLYGLKQAPRKWYKRFDTFIIKIRFERYNYENCVYFKLNNISNPVYLLLYVDNMPIACIKKLRLTC